MGTEVATLASAALVLLATSTAGAQPAVRAGDRIMLMGDSEAFLLRHDFPTVIDDPSVVFGHVAVGGSSVISWSMGLPSEWAAVMGFRPTVVLVSLGANDACTGPSVVSNEAPYLDRFLRRLARVRAREIVWVGPPRIGYPRPDRRQCTATRAVAGLELFAQLVRGRGVWYLDARSIDVQMWNDHLHCSRPQYHGDGAHGCKDWASWIWTELRK